jgi:hypothetical protein
MPTPAVERGHLSAGMRPRACTNPLALHLGAAPASVRAVTDLALSVDAAVDACNNRGGVPHCWDDTNRLAGASVHWCHVDARSVDIQR